MTEPAKKPEPKKTQTDENIPVPTKEASTNMMLGLLGKKSSSSPNLKKP